VSSRVARSPETRLPVGLKLGFGVCDLGGNLFFTIMGFYMLFFLTDHLGLRAGLAGTALMIGKAWDAVTDPAVGYLSDRTRTRWGRRRPYIFVGSIALFFTMILMFTNVGFESQIALFLWVGFTYCLLNTAYTLINIPYGALTPEITTEFYERTVLNGYRMVFAVVGTFVGAAAVLPLLAAFGGGDLGWTMVGVVMGAVMAVTALITFFTVKEDTHPPAGPGINVFRSYFEVLRMKPFVTALIPWACHITGINIIQASLLYYFRVIYGFEAGFQIALPILLGSSMVFIPIWVKISARIGKKASYNIGMGIFAVTVVCFFLFGHLAGVELAYVLMFIAGIGFATQYVMPFAIVPDVVEYDFADTGVRREGVFYGLWTFVSKMGQAFGIALNGWVLTWFGYQESVAGAPVPVQTEAAQFGIRLLVGPIPAVFFIIGIVVLLQYPINTVRYQEIMDRIAQRDAGATT